MGADDRSLRGAARRPCLDEAAPRPRIFACTPVHRIRLAGPPSEKDILWSPEGCQCEFVGECAVIDCAGMGARCVARDL